MFPKDVGYSLPDWLVDVTSSSMPSSVKNANPIDANPYAIDGDAESAPDFASLWVNSSEGQAFAKEHELAVAAEKSNPSDLKSLPSTGPGQLHALKTLLSYRMTTHYKS